MAAREQSGTNVDQSVIQRVIAGVRYAVSGVTPTSWFGPSQPLAPQAQEQTEGRAFDYPVGYNLRIQPREGEAVSFAQMRGLADAYDLLRLVIETRKDQIASFDWEIVPREKDVDAEKFASEIKRVSDFLEYPDREHSWDQWLRMQVEDMLVIDTVAVFPRGTRGGELYALELVDGATLKRVIDELGRTPAPPDPAYQQILKGIVGGNYSADDMVYTMRNPRTNRLYGYSPVEQVITTVNIAIRRQMTQLAYYTEGNIPEAIAQMPASWTGKQIAEFQTWWDSVMEGNLAQKRKMRFIPNLDNIQFPKSELLKDEYDEWLARIICYAFSTTPAALIKQVNRASGEQMADTAKEEGLIPLLRFVSQHMTRLVQRHMGAPGLKFQFRVLNKVDPKAQAEIHAIYVENQVLTPDEVRDDLGKEKLTPADREAAFPKPPPAPVMGQEGETNDGQAEPKKSKPGAPAANDETKPAERETAAEKMLAQALRMLDPTVIAKMMSDHVRAQPPQVIEFRPETNVEVGDTNVHVPAARPGAADAAFAKLLAKSDGEGGDGGSLISISAPVTVNVPERETHLHAEMPITVQPAAPAQVNVPVTVQPAAPAQVNAPITVNTTETTVQVKVPEQGATEEIIERDHKDDIQRVVRRPLKS